MSQPSTDQLPKRPKQDIARLPGTAGKPIPSGAKNTAQSTETPPRGCLGFLTGQKHTSEAEEGQRRPLRNAHRYRPVSSCSGRIRTMLIANQRELKRKGMFSRHNVDEIFHDHFAFMQVFQDDTRYIPGVWMMLNYAYHFRDHQKHTPEKEIPKGKAAIQNRPVVQTKNLHLVRRNFDIRKFINEFTALIGEKKGSESEELFSRLDTEWLQDPFYAMESPENDVIILDPHYSPQDMLEKRPSFLRSNLTRRFIAREIATSMSAVLKPTKFVVEGGNILADQDFMLMGADSFLENWTRFAQDETEESMTFGNMRDEMAASFGVKTILIPGLFEKPNDAIPATEERAAIGIPRQHGSLFHLDLFLALGGYDPDSGKQVVFVAECVNDVQNGKWDRLPQKRKSCHLTGKGLNEYLDEIAAWFSDPPAYVTDELKRVADMKNAQKRRERKQDAPPTTAFQVHRVPCYFDETGGEEMVSFLNGHVENYRIKGRKQPVRCVYMPEYGHENDDSPVRRTLEAARSAYASAGYKVVLVNYGLDWQVARGGSLHCMTKVMQRYPYDSSELMDLSNFQVAFQTGDYKWTRKLGFAIKKSWSSLKSIFRFQKD